MMEGMIKGKTYVGSSFILVQRGACSYNKDKSKKGKRRLSISPKVKSKNAVAMLRIQRCLECVC